jgi:hypothetical protein
MLELEGLDRVPGLEGIETIEGELTIHPWLP